MPLHRSYWRWHRGDSPILRAGAITASLSLALFSVWALIKPPYQGPDGFAHHLRALSIPAARWNVVGQAALIDQSRYNPLLGWVAAVVWTQRWSVSIKVAVLAFVLLNPMLTFVSSGISTDAVLNPLGNLIVLYSFRALTRNADKVTCALLLFTASMVKGTGLMLCVALAGLYAVRALRPSERAAIARDGALVALFQLATGYVLFHRASRSSSPRCIRTSVCAPTSWKPRLGSCSCSQSSGAVLAGSITGPGGHGSLSFSSSLSFKPSACSRSRWIEGRKDSAWLATGSPSSASSASSSSRSKLR